MVQVGLSILLQPVVNFVVGNLELEFFCLSLPLNFKPYFIMSSKVITEDMLVSPGPVKNPIISVMISTYPLANKGYLVSFFKDGSDGKFEPYDLACSLDFEASKLSTYLDYSSIFLPVGCYYLSSKELAGFIKALSFGAETFEMDLLVPSAPMQGFLVVNVDEKSLSKYEQEEED